MKRAAPSPLARTVLRFATSLTLLLLLGQLVDVGVVATRLTDLRPSWVLAGIGISIGQIFLLAWRWKFTAARLGIELPFRNALTEYYLGVFLNQVLPGGVTGDVSRAWRHARTDVETGPAVSAVILERLSAQVIMTTVAAASVLALPQTPAGLRLAGAATVLSIAVGLVWGARRSSDGAPTPDGIRARTREALLAPGAWPFQMTSGATVVASYIVVYLIAARAVGVDTPLLELLPLVAPVLMTMLIPVTVAGWGIREGAAAGLWSVVGLTPEDGVAISVAYGLLVLVSSAPGAFVLTSAVAGGPGRKGRPDPEENG